MIFENLKFVFDKYDYIAEEIWMNAKNKDIDQIETRIKFHHFLVLF